MFIDILNIISCAKRTRINIPKNFRGNIKCPDAK